MLKLFHPNFVYLKHLVADFKFYISLILCIIIKQLLTLLVIVLEKRLLTFLFLFVFLLILKTGLLLCFHFLLDFLFFRLALLIMRKLMAVALYWQLTVLEDLLSLGSKSQEGFGQPRYLLLIHRFSKLYPWYHSIHSFLALPKLFQRLALTFSGNPADHLDLVFPANTFTHLILAYSLTS